MNPKKEPGAEQRILRQEAFNRLAKLEDRFFQICERWGCHGIRDAELPLALLQTNGVYRSLKSQQKADFNGIYDRIKTHLSLSIMPGQLPADEKWINDNITLKLAPFEYIK